MSKYVRKGIKEDYLKRFTDIFSDVSYTVSLELFLIDEGAVIKVFLLQPFFLCSLHRELKIWVVDDLDNLCPSPGINDFKSAVHQIRLFLQENINPNVL